MKVLIYAILSILILSPVIYADEASHRTAVEEYLIITKTDQSIEPMFDELEKAMDGVANQMGIPEEDRPLFNQYARGFLKILRAELGWDKMKEDVIRIYQETFTEDEMKAFIAFYKSPAGQVYVEKIPLLTKKIVEMSQKNMPELIKRLEAFEAQVSEYIQIEKAKKTAEEKNKPKGM